MKDLIKKILREDLGWVNDVDAYGTINHYISWLNGNHKKYWKNGFENIPEIVGYPRMDAETMVRAGRIIEDSEQSTKRRREALNEFEDYSYLGGIIEDVGKYFKYIVDYSDESGVDEDVVVELANEIIRRHLHKK
jgi:hypothetical protein